MKSEHVDKRRLYQAVRENALLNDTEIEHLGGCEECLELIRVFVVRLLNSAAS
jgi:hypothetical protein